MSPALPDGDPAESYRAQRERDLDTYRARRYWHETFGDWPAVDLSPEEITRQHIERLRSQTGRPHPFEGLGGAQSITAQATGNRWDAPFFTWTDPDGTVHLSRDAAERVRAAKPFGPGYFIPHAVVLVDGVMSAFDAARQPTEETRP